MRLQRFFVSPEQIRGRRVSLAGEQARQISRVLRLREADQIIVLDDRGWQYNVALDKVTADLVTGEISGRRQAAGEPETHLTLYQAFLKKDNFEWILQKGTEIGVTKFVPLITQRCVVRHETLKPAKIQRWQRIIREAAEQSSRGRLPVLSPPHSFPDALADVEHVDMALIPWENETENDAVRALADRAAQLPSPRIALFIGPEGGFDESEIEVAQAAGVQSVTLGPRILRAETAAVVASTIVLSAMGDLK